jgi:hypothetical protein
LECFGEDLPGGFVSVGWWWRRRLFLLVFFALAFGFFSLLFGLLFTGF